MLQQRGVVCAQLIVVGDDVGEIGLQRKDRFKHLLVWPALRASGVHVDRDMRVVRTSGECRAEAHGLRRRLARSRRLQQRRHSGSSLANGRRTLRCEVRDAEAAAASSARAAAAVRGVGQRRDGEIERRSICRSSGESRGRVRCVSFLPLALFFAVTLAATAAAARRRGCVVILRLRRQRRTDLSSGRHRSELCRLRWRAAEVGDAWGGLLGDG